MSKYQPLKKSQFLSSVLNHLLTKNKQESGLKFISFGKFSWPKSTITSTKDQKSSKNPLKFKCNVPKTQFYQLKGFQNQF